MPRKKQRIEPPNCGNINASSEVQANSDGARAGGGFSLLDDDTRLKVFHYLTWQDLASAAPTSKAFRDDCNHPSLSQNQDRQLTVRFPACSATLCRKLVALRTAGKFDKYTKLKLVWRGGARLNTGTTPSALEIILGQRMISHVTELELSYKSSVDDTPGHIQQSRAANGGKESLMWVALGQLLPNLRSLTISSHGDLISTSAPCVISEYQSVATRSSVSFGGRPFDVLVFREQSASTHLRGDGFGREVRDVDLDNCVFDLTVSNRFINEPSSVELFEEDGDVDGDGNNNSNNRQGRSHRTSTTRCIFDQYAWQLERVSMRNAKYYDTVTVDDDGVRTPVNIREVPQSGLMKFVRRATNLQWFRSDLTADNVVMLRRERPDVTFVSYKG